MDTSAWIVLGIIVVVLAILIAVLLVIVKKMIATFVEPFKSVNNHYKLDLNEKDKILNRIYDDMNAHIMKQAERIDSVVKEVKMLSEKTDKSNRNITSDIEERMKEVDQLRSKKDLTVEETLKMSQKNMEKKSKEVEREFKEMPSLPDFEDFD